MPNPRGTWSLIVRSPILQLPSSASRLPLPTPQMSHPPPVPACCGIPVLLPDTTRRLSGFPACRLCYNPGTSDVSNTLWHHTSTHTSPSHYTRQSAHLHAASWRRRKRPCAVRNVDDTQRCCYTMGTLYNQRWDKACLDLLHAYTSKSHNLNSSILLTQIDTP